ncbi:MAG: M48 family metalloprotease [Elusimicrobiota bacterium]
MRTLLLLLSALAAGPLAAQDIADDYLAAQRKMFAARAQFEAERAQHRLDDGGVPASPGNCRAFRETLFKGKPRAVPDGPGPLDAGLDAFAADIMRANRLDIPGLCPAFTVRGDDFAAHSWIDVDPDKPVAGAALAELRRTAPRALYVLTGVIADAPDDGILAAVLAHELAHLALQHSVDVDVLQWRIEREARVSPAVMAMWDASPIPIGGYAPWWREASLRDEEEADLVGAGYLAQAGYRSSDMTRLLGYLAARSSLDDYWKKRRAALSAALGAATTPAVSPATPRVSALRALLNAH